MVLEEEGLRVQHGWILAEEERLDLHELDVLVLRLLGGELRLGSRKSSISFF